MTFTKWIVFLALGLILPCSSDDAQLRVDHSFDGKQFSPAGEVTVSANRQLVIFSRSSWTAQQKKAFDELLQRDGFYTLRLGVETNAGGSFFSSVRGRCLLTPGVKEEVQLHLDNTYMVVGFDYLLHNVSGCHLGGENVDVEELDGSQLVLAKEVLGGIKFAVPSVGVAVMDGGPDAGVPRDMRGGESAARTPKQGAEEGDKKTPEKDERTWLQKNWMFVMVAVMMVAQVMLKAAGEPAQESGGAETGGTTARPAGAGPAGRRGAGSRRG